MSERRRRSPCHLTARLLLLTLLAQSAGGCSLAAVVGPPETPQPNPPPPLACTTNMFLPIADGVSGGMVIIETGVQVVADQMKSGSATVPLMILGAGAVALFLYSSGVGMDRVDACREAKAKELRRGRRPPRPPPIAAPPPLAPPPPVAAPPPALDAGQPAAPPTVIPEIPAAPRVPQRTDPEE